MYCKEDEQVSTDKRREEGCQFVEVRSDVVRLHRLYWTYVEPARTDLLNLPYSMREVAELVDHYRAEQLRQDRVERERKERHQSQLQKLGVPT